MGVPVNYKGVQLDVGCRLDLLVEDEVIIEIKSAETLQDVHKINW
jgi:GxxExxY protein